ncbi:hypothetical protein BH11BAC7_BH11BAC7_23530 [soil metagenome]
MKYFVYIIQRERDKSFYKGYSEDYLKRLVEHNVGKSKYTSTKIPWKLVYVETFIYISTNADLFSSIE